MTYTVSSGTLNPTQLNWCHHPHGLRSGDFLTEGPLSEHLRIVYFQLMYIIVTVFTYCTVSAWSKLLTNGEIVTFCWWLHTSFRHRNAGYLDRFQHWYTGPRHRGYLFSLLGMLCSLCYTSKTMYLRNATRRGWPTSVVPGAYKLVVILANCLWINDLALFKVISNYYIVGFYDASKLWS